MENTNTNETQEVQTKPEDSTPIDNSIENEDLKEKRIPYERFKKVNDAYKQKLEELNQLKKEIEAEKIKQMEEQNKYKELYEGLKKEFDSYKQKAESFDNMIAEEIEKEIKGLSSEDMEFINSFVDQNMAPNDRLKKIKMLKSKIIAKNTIINKDTDSGNESSGDKKLKPGKNLGLINPEDLLRKINQPGISYIEKAELIKKYEESQKNINEK